MKIFDDATCNLDAVGGADVSRLVDFKEPNRSAEDSLTALDSGIDLGFRRRPRTSGIPLSTDINDLSAGNE